MKNEKKERLASAAVAKDGARLFPVLVTTANARTDIHSNESTDQVQR